MPWWGYIIIAVAVLLIIAVIGITFNLIAQKKEKMLEHDDNLFNKMLATVDLSISMCDKDIEIRERLEHLQDNLKYCEATNNKNAYAIDLRIAERVDDLKLSVSRAVSKGTYHSVKKAIGEIELLIVERNTYLKNYRG